MAIPSAADEARRGLSEEGPSDAIAGVLCRVSLLLRKRTTPRAQRDAKGRALARGERKETRC